MRVSYQIGDLVHIPQTALLLDGGVCENQLVIPVRVKETKKPQLGVVTHLLRDGYVQVYCDGARWSVKDNSVYKI